MDEPRLDLSALDAYPDRRRFERAVAAITAGALAPPESPVLLGLVRWGRIGLVAAAAVALAAWTPALLDAGGAVHSGAAASDPVQLVAEWARAGTIPGDASLFQLTGASDVR